VPGVPSDRPDADRSLGSPLARTAGFGDPDCPLCRGLGYIQRDDLPMTDPQFGKIQVCACQADHLQQQRAARLRADSNIAALGEKTFANFLPEGSSPDPTVRATVRNAFTWARNMAANPDQPDKDEPKRKWLLLMGSYGSGKTHLAAAIANQCLADGKPALFLNTPDLLDFLRETYAPSSTETYSDRFDEIRDAPLLILDDLGTESPTAWAVEKLYQLLNYRYNAKLPTVVTTNKRLEDMEPRIGSRLSDTELVFSLQLLAPDFRSGANNPTADVSTLGVHRDQTFENLDLRNDLAGEARQMYLNAQRAAREYAEDPDGWFVLVGPYATGKTHLAAAMANLQGAFGRQAYFVTYHDLMELFRSGGRDADERNGRALQILRNVPFLVIDDVSAMLATAGYFRDRFFQVFNHRWDANLPTVLTTSADDKELDPRIKSRIFLSERCQVHVLKIDPYQGKRRRRR
jgi:DNA replication protein DnaC